MGQTEVYDAIISLGGQATYAQIRDYLRVRGYCENSIHTPLRRLKHNGSVRVKSFGRHPVYVIPLATATYHDGARVGVVAPAVIPSSTRQSNQCR
ncbi:MAG: hypothetical protein HRF40_00655 [Nitrososphaera sp.]|jgi:hypothetical protein